MLILLKAYWVLFLLPLPWLLRRILPAAQSNTGAFLRVPFFHEIHAIAGKQNRSTQRPSLVYRLLLLVIWLCLVLAAAQPLHVGDPVSINPHARDLMLAVDTSQSMEIQDMRLHGEPVDRLTVIKSVVDDFISHRKNDRIGLILFGTQAYLQTPLTFDHKTVRTLLNESRIGIAGGQTAIGDAIGLALKRLKNHKTGSKVLILLTDGANTAGSVSPVQAAELAARQGMKIYTVGVGADEMRIPGVLGFGSQIVNPSADLDEVTMKKIASLTGAQYFRARNTDELRRIYQHIDKLEPIEVDPETYRPVRNLFYFPLGIALLLSVTLVLSSLVRNRYAASETSSKEDAHD
ncbi:von Willebrand factor, type A protein [gamma proteobacterium HdN1]|nr:von Willebrand factor, type A protein [gamma proteobacterium HdN1]